MFFAHRKSGNVGAGCGKGVDDISLAENVAEIQYVPRGQIVIEAHAELIVVGGFILGGDESVVTDVGLRVVPQQVLRNGIDERQLVERERLRSGSEQKENLPIRPRRVTGVNTITGTVEVAAHGSRGAQLTKISVAFIQ